MGENGNGHNGHGVHNGNGNGRKPVSISSLAGHVKTYERSTFAPASIDSIIDQIKELGQTGAMKLHFHNGTLKAAEFERETTDRNKKLA